MWHAIGFFLSNFVFFLALLCVKNCNFLYFMDKFYLRVWKHGDFLISVFQYMDIGKYPCIETRRCHNCHVSIHGDRICDFHRLAISVFQYMVIAKLSCIKHGYFWISMFQYMDLEKYPCIETRRCTFFDALVTPHPCLETRLWYHNRVQKHGDVSFFYAPVTSHPCLETRIWYHNRVQKHGDVLFFLGSSHITSVFGNTDMVP